MLPLVVSCLFCWLFLTSLNLGFNEVERFISNFYLKGSNMFLNDLLDLHDLSLSDDSALNELRTAINVYAEENDMLFTEVLDLLKEKS